MGRWKGIFGVYDMGYHFVAFGGFLFFSFLFFFWGTSTGNGDTELFFMCYVRDACTYVGMYVFIYWRYV